MISFAIDSFQGRDFNTLTPIKLLEREGKILVEDFASAIAKDNNVKRELDEIYAIIEYVANRLHPNLPETKYRILKGIKAGNYQAYEAKSKHLRLYLFFDKNMIIIFGGKKTEQPKDIKRVKNILKEYQNSK